MGTKIMENKRLKKHNDGSKLELEQLKKDLSASQQAATQVNFVQSFYTTNIIIIKNIINIKNIISIINIINIKNIININTTDLHPHMLHFWMHIFKNTITCLIIFFPMHD